MISLYHAGNSVIHKLSAAAKLLGLTAVLLMMGSYVHTILGASIAVTAVGVAYLLSGLPKQILFRQIWQLKFLILIVLLPQLIFNGIEKGTANAVAVLAGVLLAALVSLTTKTSEIVELIQRITKSRSFALLVALSLNAIVLVVAFSKNISEAGRARGVKLNPVRQIVTLFVVSLRFADDYAEALAARGVVV